MKTGSLIYSKTKRSRLISKRYIIEGKSFQGCSFKLGAKSLVLAKARHGFIMCGYLNLKTAQKLGDAAALVKGVSTVRELLNAKILATTKMARKYGLKKGMSGKEAILKLS